MMDLLPILFVYTLFLGAMMAPGPDFFIVVRNALGYSARAGIMTAVGIALALIIHVTYCIAGIGLLISNSIIAFTIIKYAGAAYLFYLGVQSMRSSGADAEKFSEQSLTKDIRKTEKSDRSAFLNGFVTNLLNPKATLFFVALFSQSLDPETPLSHMMLLGFMCIITSALWFSGVAIFMATPAIRKAYGKASKWIDRVFGALFVALAAKLALARN